MQSRLPDVNTAFIKHRNGAIEGIASKNWDKTFGSLYAWNSLLPDMVDDAGHFKYRVTVSDNEYQKLTQKPTQAECTHCKKLCNYATIQVVNMMEPLIIGILTNQQYSKSWKCDHCDKINRLIETNILQPILQEPHYLKVVPKPPHRQDGLNDRGKYERRVTQWAWNFISELENSSGRFREDYKDNKGDFTEWEEQFDGGEQ